MSVAQVGGGLLTQPATGVFLAHPVKKQGTQGNLEHEVHIATTDDDVSPRHEVGNGDFEDDSQDERRERRQD